MENKCDILIVGSGIAGITAAIYSLRADKKTVIVDSNIPGGKINPAMKIENYPGIKEISGTDLCQTLVEQLKENGGSITRDKIVKINPITKEAFGLHGSYKANAIILATGTKDKIPEVKDCERYIGRGLSFCAMCDGALHRGKDVCVIGGGNTALSDALYLADICRSVYLVHRRDTFRAEKVLVDRAMTHPNIKVFKNAVVTQLCGEINIDGADISVSGKSIHLNVSAVFSAIGYVPENELYLPYVETDENGFACVGESCKTLIDGLFIAGDCRRKKVRQLTTAAADGANAAQSAGDYIQNCPSDSRL